MVGPKGGHAEKGFVLNRYSEIRVGTKCQASSEAPLFSVIVPAYNEEEAIDEVIKQLLGILSEAPLQNSELIIVDDGSKDRTSDVVYAHSEVTLIRYAVNRGYGAALKSGIRHARAPIIVITDADGTYPNERIPDLVHRMLDGHYDMVVGARTGSDVAIPLSRRPAKWVISKLANFISGSDIPDLNSGLRAFRRDVVTRFFNLLPDGFSFTTTITLGMLSNGYLVDFVSINYHARVGKSKIKPIRDTLNFVLLTFRNALFFAPMKIFVPIGITLVLAGIMWGVFSSLVLNDLADVSTLFLIISGFQIMVLGLLAVLINYRLPNQYREE